MLLHFALEIFELFAKRLELGITGVLTEPGDEYHFDAFAFLFGVDFGNHVVENVRIDHEIRQFLSAADVDGGNVPMNQFDCFGPENFPNQRADR